MIIFLVIALLISFLVAGGGGAYKYSGAIVYTATLAALVVLLLNGY